MSPSPSQSFRLGHRDLLLFAAWIVALAATLGALFIGEIMGQAPCVLCWWQRVFMFPLAIMLGMAAFRSDPLAVPYALALTMAGALVAVYHNLIYFKLIDESMSPCTAGGPSCTSADMTILGSVPLPLLSLAAFAAVTALLTLITRRDNS